ncbi:MAG: zinc-dependent peptidase [Planctomycetes bacterium]|nr:zinc-dependent peptidase [Planctomycetota bacterium]
MPLRLLRNWRRRRWLKQPIPPTWLPHLNGLPFYKQLAVDEQSHLQELVQVFVREKYWEGCGGLDLDNHIKVVIAAQACYLILHLDHDWYRNVKTILVYPTAFLSNMPATGPDGVVGPASAPHAGEAWMSGQVILAWDSAFSGGRNPDDGHNTVYHEFAHKLDMLDGFADGAPPLGSRDQQKRWTEVLSQHFKHLRADTAVGRRQLIDSYGATNPAEFFAVATEVFFERGAKMKKLSPDLFECLEHFYRPI